MPNRPLVTLLLSCLATWAAVAAPAPKPRPWVTGWTEVDPDRDCGFRREGEALTIELPAKEHDLDAARPLMNAPRLERTVVGDFVAQVRAGGNFSCGRDKNVRAGLVLWAGEKTYLVLEWSGHADTKPDASFSWWGEGRREDTPPGLPGEQPADRFSGYLRMERRGETVRLSFTQDGHTWTEVAKRKERLPAKLRLGVFAASDSGAPFKPRFDHFTLTLMSKK